MLCRIMLAGCRTDEYQYNIGGGGGRCYIAEAVSNIYGQLKAAAFAYIEVHGQLEIECQYLKLS